ncbi:MAG TPA: ABC transporter ATP-binding protein [Clostridia bacterium]|nr:ABC transporter ATP-binding protein [Clostridia bacterium]
MAVIELQKLTKYYGKHRGIKNITFDIKEGEIFGFIGPNGAGKSTTIRTLLNFIYPSGGKAFIFGKDVVKDSLAIRRDIGYLPSEVYYYDDMRVSDLLRYSQAFYKKENSRKMKELADRLDLNLNKKIEDLSFGNKKKVGIIQAMLHEPKLLILDEPTGGLDPLIRNAFFELLKEENDRGATIFFSSHILSEVESMCSRVAIIKEGELIKVETIENLIREQFKKVTITFSSQKGKTFKIEGGKKPEWSGNTLQLLYRGEMKNMLQKLNEAEVKDLLIEEPSLDEVFMHYYEH